MSEMTGFVIGITVAALLVVAAVLWNNDKGGGK